MRVEQGVEDKGILITSDRNIAVYMNTKSSYNRDETPDSAILRPITEDGTEYFVASFDITTTSSAWWPKSFYMVVATEDDTQIEVYHNNMLDANATISRHQVFTQDAYRLNNDYTQDYTGARVLANKPVKVYAGHGAVELYHTVCNL